MDLTKRWKPKLPRRPAQLRRQSLTAQECGWRSDWRVFPPSHAESPPGERLSIIDGDRIIAEAILWNVPDDTMVVMLPGEHAAGNSVQSDQERSAVVTLLCETATIARQPHLRFAYLLQPTGAEAGRQHSLSLAGFRLADQIHELTAPIQSLTAGRADSGGLKFLQIPATGLPGLIENPETTAACTVDEGNSPELLNSALCSLLQNLISHSFDLTNVTPPSPAQLLRLWRLMIGDVRATIAMMGDSPVGLVVLSCPDWSARKSVTIEYLGIHSNVRRRSIATDLLRNAFSELRESGCRSVTTFVADRNTTASRFFQKRGFRTRDRQQLWVSESHPV